MRFTCTLKTFMKIERRRRGASPMPSSTGGGASTMGSNMPSAGDTSRFSPCGGVRSGSRKKAMHQSVNGANSAPAQRLRANSAALMAAKSAMNGQPSRWIGTLMPRLAIPRRAGTQRKRAMREAPPFANVGCVRLGHALAAERKRAEGAGLHIAGNLVAVDRAGGLERHGHRRGDLGRPGDRVAVHLAVLDGHGTLRPGLRAGEGVAIGFDVEGDLLRAHGRVDCDVVLAVDGHLSPPLMRNGI